MHWHCLRNHTFDVVCSLRVEDILMSSMPPNPVKPAATAGVSDYGAGEMSGPLPRFSDAALAEAATADPTTGTDITGAAAAQWAALGMLGDDTSDVAFEPAAEAAPAAAPELQAEAMDEAQPEEAEAPTPAEPQADAAANPASPALAATDAFGRRLLGSPDSGRCAQHAAAVTIRSLGILLGHILQACNDRCTQFEGTRPAPTSDSAVSRFVPQYGSKHGAGRGHADARPDAQHHGRPGRWSVHAAGGRRGLAVL